MGPRGNGGRPPDPDPRRVPLAGRLHRTTRAGEFPRRAAPRRRSTTSTVCRMSRRAWTASRWIPRSSPSASSIGSRSNDGPDCCGSTSSPAGTTGSRPARASPSRGATATSPGTRARSSAGSPRASASPSRGTTSTRPPRAARRAATRTPSSGSRGTTSRRRGSAFSIRSCGPRRTGGRSCPAIRSRATPSVPGSTRCGPTPRSGRPTGKVTKGSGRASTSSMDAPAGTAGTTSSSRSTRSADRRPIGRRPSRSGPPRSIGPDGPRSMSAGRQAGRRCRRSR